MEKQRQNWLSSIKTKNLGLKLIIGLLSIGLIGTIGIKAGQTLTSSNIWTVTSINSGDIVTASAFEEIRNALKWGYEQQLLVSMGCAQTITVGSYEVCASNSYKNAKWFYNNYESGMIAAGHGGLYDRYTAIKTDGTGPCSNGFKLPSYGEWTAMKDAEGGYSQLKTKLGIKLSGYRNRNNGSFNKQGSNGYYWSSRSFDSTYAWEPKFSVDGGFFAIHNRHFGLAVRCIKG